MSSGGGIHRLPPWARTGVISLGVALAYFAIGQLSLLLAVPPDYASPFFPAAGLALAAVLSLGRRYVPAVALGAVAVELLLAHQRGSSSVMGPLLIGCGAALQAWVGAWAVRRWVAQPLLLSEPRDVAAFFGLSVGLACFISPTLGTATLLAVGSLPMAQAANTWLHWWLGDMMGMLIGAPIALTLFGQPRSAWAVRRLSVGLPLCVVALLMALAIVQVARWDSQRAQDNFERDAGAAGNAMQTLLREPLMALEAARGLLVVSPQVTRRDFERATAPLVQADSALLAIGTAVSVPRDRLTMFDATAHADGLAGFAAYDRSRPGDIVPPAQEPMMAIRLIEPLARNQQALGVNILSIPLAREALSFSQRTGAPAATAGFQLSQDKEDATGVVVYQALDQDAAVFVTIRPDLLLARAAAKLSPGLQPCLVDADTATARRRLAGPPGCEHANLAVPLTRKSLDFGGRNWEIQISAPLGLRYDDARSWPFAIVGLLAGGLMGALLLLVTGRARLIEVLVEARTAQLKEEGDRRAENALALRDSEQRLRNIFDNAPIGIVFTDMAGLVQEANPYFCQLLGYTAEQLQQLWVKDITNPEDLEEDRRLGLQLLSGEIAIYRRFKRYRSADGQTVQVRTVVTLLRDAQGQPYRRVGVVEDVGDQLRMQALERARQAADAANQAKTEFLSRMSHELRTPLNAMLGFAQLLELDVREPLRPRQLARTVQIQKAGWHLLEMINDTLDLSRIEAGSLKLTLVRLDLSRLLDEVEALLDTDARARRLTVVRKLAVDARQAVGDATRVKQVLTNLLSNAVKYNVDGGSITLSSRLLAAEGLVELSVIDTGLGLSAAQLNALFQPYNRLGRENSRTPGVGIGLVISQRLAEMMGGTLSATSVEGIGSRFMLRLPCVPIDENAF